MQMRIKSKKPSREMNCIARSFGFSRAGNRCFYRKTALKRIMHVLFPAAKKEERVQQRILCSLLCQ